MAAITFLAPWMRRGAVARWTMLRTIKIEAVHCLNAIAIAMDPGSKMLLLDILYMYNGSSSLGKCMNGAMHYALLA